MTDVEKSEILHIWHVCDVENVAIYATIYAIFATIYAIFATIYALSCGEKLSPKVHLWRKNDKYEVCSTFTYLYFTEGENRERFGWTRCASQR